MELTSLTDLLDVQDLDSQIDRLLEERQSLPDLAAYKIAHDELEVLAKEISEASATLRTLELAPLHSKTRAAWVVRLRYAYADILEAAGREQDALTWFHRTQAIDGEAITDADERAEALERRLPGE